MEKVTINITPEEWGHLITKYNPNSMKLSAADFTSGTINVETDSTGALTKRKGGPNYNTTLLAAAPKDQFEAIFSDGARHLMVVQSGEVKYSSGDTIFNTVVNGTGFSSSGNFEFVTTQDRVYGGNGINAPQVYDRQTSYGGVAYTAPRMKAMGLLAPVTAPTAGAPTAGGNVPNGAHTYKVTFLYYDSQESNGSPASAVQTAGAGNNTIPLTAIPVGGYGVTARKIYRDNNDGLYLHLDTIANNTATTYNDTLAVGVTPTEIPEGQDAPSSFSRITLWLDQLWVSGVSGDPSTLFYSDTDRPDIFPSSNQILCNQEDPITAHVVYFDRLIVFNRRSMGQILGKTSDTYRYAAIPSSIGCVDNRTVQIRVVEGVPILIWLSDRGFYSYDGNSIDYISDEIEDLVNFNIQQALQQKNSIAQSTFSGTAEDGISLTEVPGSIVTRGYLDGTSTAGTNPRRTWNDQADWEGAAINTNTRTKDGDNVLRAPTRFAPASFDTNGTHSGTTGATALTLPISTNFSGVGPETGTYFTQTLSSTKFAYSARPTRSGSMTNVALSFRLQESFVASTASYQVVVWNDLAGQPGTELFTSSPISASAPLTPSINTVSVNMAVSVPMVAGQQYWFGIKFATRPIIVQTLVPQGSFDGSGGLAFDGGPDWGAMSASVSGGATAPITYTFCSTAISGSGIWTSEIFDSKSASISTGLNITHTGSYVAAAQCSGTPVISAQTVVEGSDVANFAGGAQVSQNIANVNGTSALTLSGKRYWRVKLSLTTTDDRATPSLGLPVLTFNNTATWESETIDTTAQSTVFNALTAVSTVPAGTTLTLTIATSASASGPWTGSGNADGAFGAFGSLIVRRYTRVRAVLVTDGTNTTTPILTSLALTWTISAKYTSTIIDTAVNPPAGWDLFLSQFDTNGGTVSFEMRSATTSGGIPAATFFAVTPGDFPALTPPNQFTQWRVTLVATDGMVPEVESVTVQWFISQVTSIRPASIFADGRYYVSLAEVGSTTNNILLQIDLKGKWRRLSGLNIATFSYFFNRPYFGLASSGQIRRFIEGTTDAGTNIVFDYRTKAFDYSTAYRKNASKMKVVGEVVLHGVNTGAAFQVFYSVDNGATFINMITNSGSTTFTSTSDETDFHVRFRPLWDGSNDIDGRTIMYRVLNSDANRVEVHGIEEATAFLRKQSTVVTG
jgi:hypothetical protein